MDHHFVDRSPAHAHVFTGDATNDHAHMPAFALADHDHSSGVNGDGISVLSTSVSAAQGPLTLDGATLELLAPRYDNQLTALFAGELTVAGGPAIAPPGRPPYLG